MRAMSLGLIFVILLGRRRRKGEVGEAEKGVGGGGVLVGKEIRSGW